MASPFDLVTLSQVTAWTGITSDDANMGPLISQVSRAILNSLNRPSILPRSYTETFDGDGHDRHVLAHWPVTAVSVLTIDGTVIAASPPVVAGQPQQRGYVIEADQGTPPGHMQEIILRFEKFWRGKQNCIVTYEAGYQILGDAQSVPSGSPYQVTAMAPYGAWAIDQGVTYSDGAPLSAVANNPAQGQYSVSAGVYTFNAADAGAAIILNYGYIPLDLAEAALEWIAERYAYKSRVGQRSKSLGGQETVSFIVSRIPDFIDGILQPYRRVVPLS